MRIIANEIGGLALTKLQKIEEKLMLCKSIEVTRIKFFKEE